MAYTQLTGGSGVGGDYQEGDEWTPAIATEVRDNFDDHEARVVALEGAGGAGDVVGPASATDNAIARYDSTTGKLVQNSGITIADGATGTLAGSNSGDVTLAGTPTYLTIVAQVLTRALIDLASHITGRLPFANLTQGSALSVLGVTGNATADHASIAAGSDTQVLRRSGTALGFGAVDLSSSAAVTGDLPLANLVPSSAASKLLGRGGASGAGDFEELTLGTGLSLSGTTLSASGSSSTPNTGLMQGRLTTETGVAVSTSDRTAQSTIYFTPYNGNRVALYSGSAWAEYALTERSLALSGLTSGKNYDVFLYDNSGTLTLELSAAWTNDSTRADALTTQDGVYVKSGATTRRLVGTIRTTGTTTTEDSAAKRFVWNLYNRVLRHMKAATETTDSWNYTTSTWRQANANTANQLDYVVGLNDHAVTAEAFAVCGNNAGFPVAAIAGIGVNSTSASSAHFHGHSATTLSSPSHALYNGMPGLGRNFLAWLEYSGTSGTTTWYGDAGDANLFQSGILGQVWG